MTTAFDIERRLRLPAPDEPAVLPALVLPSEGWIRPARPGVRFRVPRATPQGARLVYAVVALLLLLAAAIAVGALRLLEQERNPLADVCATSDGRAAVEAACLTVDIPEGWQQLASGSLFPGDFTDVPSGIAYERTELVLSNVQLADCPSPGPFPTAYPIGTNAFEQPRETPDVGLLCWRTAPLPPNAIRIETMKGDRVSGMAAADGPAIPDTSEPTAEAGWTEEVAARPARLTITPGIGAGGAPAESRTWDVLLPGRIDRILRIRADIAGPDVAAGRAAVQRFVDSVRFEATTPPIDEDDAADVLRATLDTLDRTTRESHSDLYGCFPREPGNQAATISGGFAGPLAGPLEVRCSSAISVSRAGVWRIVLEVSWDAGDGYSADTLRTEYFPRPPDAIGSGGYVVSLAGRSDSTGWVDALLPNGAQSLPPPLSGPLAIPPGSVARLLAPGVPPVEDPAQAEENVSAPGVVGLHLYVVRGPELIDGDEWYRVQWDGSASFSGLPNQLAWARGTMNGRPLLAVVEPACPAGDPAVEDISWLVPAERLACFGARELTIEAGVLESFPTVPEVCSSGDGMLTACPASPGDPVWLTASTAWQMYGEGGKTGPAPGLPVWLAPSLDTPSSGDLVRVTGHFDDPAARGCRWGDIGASGFGEPPAEIHELLCRERFVITGFEPATE